MMVSPALPAVRLATGIPACAPRSVTAWPSVTVPGNVPAPTLITSPAVASVAAYGTVAHGVSELVQSLSRSSPPTATKRSARAGVAVPAIARIRASAGSRAEPGPGRGTRRTKCMGFPP